MGTRYPGKRPGKRRKPTGFIGTKPLKETAENTKSADRVGRTDRPTAQKFVGEIRPLTAGNRAEVTLFAISAVLEFPFQV